MAAHHESEGSTLETTEEFMFAKIATAALLVGLVACDGAEEAEEARAATETNTAPEITATTNTADPSAVESPAEDPTWRQDRAVEEMEPRREAPVNGLPADLGGLLAEGDMETGYGAGGQAMRRAAGAPQRRHARPSIRSSMASPIQRPSPGRQQTSSTTRPPNSAVPRANLPRALPQNGVLASNFVGGSGVRARLDDLLDRGVMVGGELVRLEAFQDRERLPYAVPAREGMAMYAELERTRLSEDSETVHLQIALMGRQGEAPVRPNMDIRLVLDRSGSMRGEKWSQAIAAAHALIEKLEPTDRFGLISYSDEARLDHAPRAVGNRRAAHADLDRLVPGGGTNISSALEMAHEHAPRARANRTVGLTILVSDGRATMGQLNPEELGSLSRATFDRSGVLTTAIGLGTDFDERTMLSIAREGSGSYHFVRRAADITDILQDELDARVQAVAQGLRVRVELGEGITAKRVYGSRLLSEREHAAVRATEVAVDQRIARELGVARTRQNEDERGLRIHLPTFRRGDQHAILMELEVPAGTDITRIAKVTLDYKDLIRRQNGTVVREVEARRVSDPAAAQASVNRPVKRTVLAFQGGEALQSAADALQRGDAANAHRILAERRELLEAASSLWRDPSLRRDATLLSRYERVVDHAWNQWDSQAQTTLVMAMNYFGDQRMR